MNGTPRREVTDRTLIYPVQLSGGTFEVFVKHHYAVEDGKVKERGIVGIRPDGSTFVYWPHDDENGSFKGFRGYDISSGDGPEDRRGRFRNLTLKERQIKRAFRAVPEEFRQFIPEGYR